MDTCKVAQGRTSGTTRACPGKDGTRGPTRLGAGLLVRAAALAVAVAAPGATLAGQPVWSGWPDSLARAEHWRLAVSPFTQHWRPSDEHRMVRAVALERFGDDGRFWGVSYFTNSFGQPSGYAFIGQRYQGVLGQPSMYVQWSGGMMYGYTGKYQHKVPMNYKGFSPGFVPSLGFNVTPRTSLQYNLLGDAGVMFQITHDWR
jgi:hypothetical protein